MPFLCTQNFWQNYHKNSSNNEQKKKSSKTADPLFVCAFVRFATMKHSFGRCCIKNQFMPRGIENTCSHSNKIETHVVSRRLSMCRAFDSISMTLLCKTQNGTIVCHRKLRKRCVAKDTCQQICPVFCGPSAKSCYKSCTKLSLTCVQFC